MFISFTVKNWESFRDEATFSMVAGRELQHRDRLPHIDKLNLNLLPVSVIYGGNASGKTRFFNALAFAQDFIVQVTQPEELISVKPYKLSKLYQSKPSSFTFNLLIGDNAYEFSFTVDSTEVIEEKLIDISKTKEQILYERKKDKEVEFNKNHEFSEIERLKFVANGTRRNQLFLTNSINQNIPDFKALYDWFKYTLTLISPTTYFGSFGKIITKNSSLFSSISKLLPQLDTGITRLSTETIPLNNLSLPEEAIKHLPDGKELKLSQDIILIKEKGVLIAKRLISYHQSEEGEEIPFKLTDESAGTLRILDLLAAFCHLFHPNSSKVYLIDELDRSLHTMMTSSLVETYLSLCNAKSRSQLLFTTHDGLLMKQEIFRRDEIWIVERTEKGSSLVSLGEYKNIRYDKDIRKSYLEGRFGGIPKITLSAF